MSAPSMDEIDVCTYSQHLFGREDEVLVTLREEARSRDLHNLQIDASEGMILQLLISAIGARRVVEIGTLIGYSAIWLARALPSTGKLITLEHDPEHKAIAEQFIRRSGLQRIIEVRLGEACDLLPDVASDGPYDACFIDANWGDYPGYLDWALRNIRIGGLIIAHNAHYFGFIGIDPALEDFEARLAEVSEEAATEYRDLNSESRAEFRASLETMRRFNARMASEGRLLSAMLPTSEGLVVGLVKSAQ